MEPEARRHLMAGTPVIVLFVTWGLSRYTGDYSASTHILLMAFPWLLSIAGLILGILFRNSRVFFPILFQTGLYMLVTGRTEVPTQQYVTLYLGLFLFAAILVWLSLCVERGITTRYGAIKAVVVGVALLVLWAVPTIPMGIRALPADGTVPVFVPVLVLVVLCLGGLSVYTIVKNQEVALWYACILLQGLVQIHSGRFSEAFALSSGGVFASFLIYLMHSSYMMAFRDPLTGLRSRRSMDQAMLQVGSHYAIGMVDIDHFKKINDTYGHHTGDQVLRMVAGTIEQHAGRGRVFRFGGEEFAILFPRMRTLDILQQLERIRMAIEMRPFVFRGEERPEKKPETPLPSPGKGRLQVTVSIGMAQKTTGLRTPQDVIRRADRALYHAKSTGRNRIAK